MNIQNPNSANIIIKNNESDTFPSVIETSGNYKDKKEKSEIKDYFETKGEASEKPAKPHKKWLFLNYIAADCNLKEYQMKNIDSQEYVGSDANTHVVAYIDVGHKPNPFDNTWNGGRCYYITRDNAPRKINSEVISELGRNIDMSNPKTLTYCIVDAMKKFPSDYVVLIMNDHGGGFTGAMADDSDGSFMTVPQMKQALADAEKITGKKIDILGFDACLMAETEVAYELKDNARILLASEEAEGGSGWSYSNILSMARNPAISLLQEDLRKRINVTPEEFAKIVVKSCEQYQVSIPTFSATNLEKMDDVANAVNSFAEAIIDYGPSMGLKKAIKDAENYGNNMNPYKDIRDLYDIADRVCKGMENEKLQAAAARVKDAVSKAVIANESSKSTHPNSKGLSIYAPVAVGSTMGYNYDSLGFAKDTKWGKAIIAAMNS